MAWLKKFPWLSLGVLLITYSVFGWFVSQAKRELSLWLIEQGQEWGWSLSETLASRIVYILGIDLILLITIALVAPVTLMTILFGSWLKSDIKAMVSILGWSFASVFILCWFDYFVRFLILLSSAILGRLELRIAGYNEWQTFMILTFVCLSGFGLGVFSFTNWSV